MNTTNLLIVGWLILAGIYLPFYMRDKREKLKGITYVQLVSLCVVMVVGGVGILAIHFFTKH